MNRRAFLTSSIAVAVPCPAQSTGVRTSRILAPITFTAQIVPTIDHETCLLLGKIFHEHIQKWIDAGVLQPGPLPKISGTVEV
jgi:hypothetical protein